MIVVYPADMKRDIVKYNQARLLRQKGTSIRSIAKTLNISSSSASIWCRDIKLTLQQKTRLASKGQGTDILRAFAQKRHQDKLEHDKQTFEQAKNSIQKLNQKELFLTGVALYWAEGFKSKKERQVGFCNSDPRMIRFIMKWFKKALHISETDFTLRVEFNIDHRLRQEEIENYWSKITGIPKSQFTKPYLQKSKLLRDYTNRKTYYGLLRIRVRKSSQLLVQLRGWIEGMATA